MRLWKKYDLLIITAIILISLDQWTKSLILKYIPYGESWMPWEWLAPFARLVHWNNTGVAFGMFQGNNLFFAILAVLVSLAILYYYPRIPLTDPVLRLALGMQFAGAVGNLIDRVTIGHVIDFISVGNFAVFNIADASISVGVAVLILGVWIHDKRHVQNEDIAEPDLSSKDVLEEKPHGGDSQTV